MLAAPLDLGLRPCPPDFDKVFVEVGREECEAWYGARRVVITRWLTERGMERLLAERAAFVARARAARREQRVRRLRQVAKPVLDGIAVDPAVLSGAAQFLRTPRGGAWQVSPTGAGDWFVGRVRRSPAQVVEMAEKRGFSAANLQAGGFRG